MTPTSLLLVATCLIAAGLAAGTPLGVSAVGAAPHGLIGPRAHDPATAGPSADASAALASAHGALRSPGSPAWALGAACPGAASGTAAACPASVGAPLKAASRPAVSGGWSNLSSGTGAAPSVVAASAMTYDSAAGVVLLVGAPAIDDSVPEATLDQTSQTWTFQNGTWTNITASAGTPPPAVTGAMLADDPADGGVVLFGGSYWADCNEHGLNGSSVSNPPGANCSLYPGPFYYSFYPNATWWFAGGHWTQLAPGTSPPGRAWGQMAYDRSERSVILFGGLAGQGQTLTFGDTWRFSAGGWGDLTPNLTLSPPARGLAGLAWDALDGELVLFGGVTYVSTPPFSETLAFDLLLGDTWGYAHGAWTNLTSASAASPSIRWQFLMAPAPGGGVLLFGGNSYEVNWQDTWIFQNGSWAYLGGPSPAVPPPPRIVGTLSAAPTPAQLSPTPPDWYTAVMAFDAATNMTIAVGSVSYGSPSFYTWGFGAPVPNGSDANVFPWLRFSGAVDGFANNSVEVSLEAAAGGGTGPYQLGYVFGSLDTTGNWEYELQDNFTVVAGCGSSGENVVGNVTPPPCLGANWNGSRATVETILIPRPEAVYILGSVTDANGTVGIGVAALLEAPLPPLPPLLHGGSLLGIATTSGPLVWASGGASAGLALGIGAVALQTRTTRETTEGEELVRRLRETSNTVRRSS